MSGKSVDMEVVSAHGEVDGPPRRRWVYTSKGREIGETNFGLTRGGVTGADAGAGIGSLFGKDYSKKDVDSENVASAEMKYLIW